MKVKKRAVRSTLAWIITVAMMASMFVSLPVFADEEKSYDYNNVQSSNVTSNGYWTDVDNYDISWYTGNENSGSYDLTDSADLAGLAYLINNQNVSFGGKTINLTGSTYDMSAHYWVPISACSGAGPHTGGSNCTAWSGTFVIKGSESSTITGLNIIDTVAPASNAANYNYYTGFIGHMNGDVEISNIVFDNCNVEDKGNTVVQDYSSGAAVVIGEARGDSKFNNVIVQNSVISGCTKVAAFLGLKNGSNGGLTFTDCASNNNTFKALYYYNAIVGVTISSTATAVVFDNTSSVNDTFEKFDPNNEAQYFGDGNYITYNGIEYLPLAQTIGGVKYDDALVVGTTKALAAVLGTEAKEIVVNGTTYHVGETAVDNVAKINRNGKDVYYTSLKAAIEDAKVNETITPASGSVVITTAENAVLANDITVSGFNFGDGGALTVSGNGAFTITDCKFEATAAGVKTPLNLKNYGKTIVKNNTFGTENDGVYYNAVEFDVGSEVNKNGVKVADGTEISGNHFGKITHNGISIYNVEENATITIKDNIYEISASALRLSNGLVDKVNAIFNIENEWYKATDPTEGWEGYATLQTVYKNGNPEQDVTGYVLNFKNLYYGDESNKKVAEDGDGVQQIVVWNGTDFVTDAEKLPTVSITNDVLPTQSPEATATTEPSATPEATATTEPSATPEATATTEPSATPEATATAKPTSAPVVVPTPYPTATVKPNAPTATPMPEYQVQISASEEISEVLLVNKATGETIVLDMEVSEAGEITFVGSAPKGNYEIVAKAVSGKEVDVAQSDNSLKVNDDKTEAVVVATEESSIDYIEIKNAPDTVSYTEGSTFNPAGLVITVHYKDGTSQDVAYDESTKSGFTFKPGLDVSLPSADAYVGDTYVRVIYGNKYADQNVTFVMNSAEIKITAPKSNAAATFAAAVEEGSYYYSGIITWSPNVEQGGKFDYGTVYTATVTLAAKDGYSFADNAKALVNGNEAEVNEISPDGKTMTVSYTFDKTGYKNSGNSGNSGHSTGGTSTPKPAETANPNVSASPEPTKNPSSWTNPFNDVNTSDWFYDGVKYVNENGLMNGIETDTFGPYENITRGMFVTVLHRMENQPKTDMTNFGFTDVPEGSYYREAIGWASANGVVNGYTDTEFAPDQIITREQMAAMIYRYVVSKGMGPVGSWMINLDYNDVSSISDYAFEAVTYNKIIGIMSGDDNNNFNPQTAANRAEASLVFQRLANFIGQQKAE